MASSPSFDTLAERALGKGFPPHLAGMVSLPTLPPEPRRFALRALGLMRRSGYAITQFTPFLIRWLSATVPGILPNAWGGHIPPITVPGRHSKLDAYMAGQRFPGHPGQKVFVDMGCGFPPITTADTARRLSDWHIYGVDPSFADYVLYDAQGHYACFSGDGEFLYFQAALDVEGKSLYAAPDRTKHRFTALFRELHPLLRNHDPRRSATVEKNGNRLIRHHIKDFQTDRLCFIQSNLGALSPMAALAVRCMNLFLYFPPDTYQERLGRIKQHLEENGLVIVGTNGLGIQARYAVYEKQGQDLVLREFAFSLDNLGHISLMPWFTLHHNDPEAGLLADLSRVIRSAPGFWTPFSRYLDQLLAYHGLCRRKADGFLHFSGAEMVPATFLKKNALVWQDMAEKGYVQGAADVLANAGYAAWVNAAGDVAVRPSDNCCLGPHA